VEKNGKNYWNDQLKTTNCIGKLLGGSLAYAAVIATSSLTQELVDELEYERLQV